MEEAANGWKSLTSPDYPKKFNPNAECVYRISAPENERIELEFVDFLLFNNQIEDCQAQSLTIRDPMTDSPIGKYCGNTKPPNYTTMGNSLFMVLDSNTDGEYKGFHIKYRIHGSSPKMAVEAAAEQPTKKLSKGKKAQREARPGEFGAKVLAAAKNLSVKNAAASEKGEIEAQLLTQNEVNHRRRRQVNRGFGGPRRQTDYNDYQYGSTPYGRAGRGGPPAAVAPAGPKCRPGFPCPGSEYNPDSATGSSTKREIRCVGANCKKPGVSSSGSSNLIHGFVWVVVIGVFGAIGWYIYKTYFMEDEEAKKKAEEDEKKREAEGNIGAATLARGIGGAPAKGFDAPPRYESWQDHAQPISEGK